MVSWRAGVVFKPADDGSVYVGYGTSFNPAVDAASTGAAEYLGNRGQQPGPQPGGEITT
jgi:catecholate siderophore receptor